jgi:amino acid adenylation domain-containing protein
MIPSAFVVLDTLPLTPNAKIDRKALPKPDSLDHTQHSTLLPPRTPIEEALHDIFAEVLRVPQVALNIGFFELGGHSLLATQVIARIRSTFTLELPLRTLFEAPTVATLAQRVSEALGSAAGVSAPPLLRASREGSLPLSFAQQRLWFLDQLEPGSSVYHLPLALRLSGPLNVEALESSLHEIVVRHEALRTVFPLQQGVPSQQITEPHFTLQRARLQELASASSASGTLEVEAVEADTVAGLVGSWVSEQTRTPFDLQHGPLFRASLLHLSEGDHVLVLTLHHIVSDGWSMGVLTRELSALYSAYCAGEASPLEPLPLQYADYALWQRGWLQGSVLEDQLGYWKSRLSGAPALLELPTDRPRPAVQTYRGAIVRVELSSELTAGLHLLCRETGTTLFMALLGALNVLLCRYSGQHDIVVGTPIAGRTRSELEGLIGFFVNTLAMRTDLSGDPSFVALLGRIREEALGAYAHQEVPFEKLVEELSPQRSMSHAPLFQVALVVQNTPQGRPSLQGLELDILPVESRTTKFDLTFLATVKDAKLRLSLEYNTDLFDGDRMERMLQHLHTLLNAIAYHPQHSIATLPLLTPQETNTLLHHFNTAANIPTPKLPIHSQFQRVVEHNPNAIAIRTRHHHLSYQQLNAYANHIAHQLIQHNINNHHVVAIIANPSIQRIAALLAILKAGAAYLPLDPNNPTQRQQAILNDAKPSLLIADANQAQTLKDLPVPHYLLQPFDPNHTYHDPGNLPNNTHPDDLAYLLFTSGSTGVPKGVGVPHRAVMRLVSQPNFCQLGPQEVVLHLAPLAFDASTFEIWAPLLNGGSLALFEGEQPDLQELASCIQHHRVSTLWLTAGLFHAMVEGAIWGLRGVRQLLAGGDVLSPSHVGRVLAEVAGCTLINGYGPTENTTFSSCYRVGPDWDGVGSVPIGRGINGTRLYVVDARGQLVGIGVAGELYVGGCGLAQGYLKRADLTAERFVPDALSGERGARLYRTGDRVRWRVDGTLEYLGRLDHQVKLRGFRIELGEIESVLRSHPGVVEAVVLAREDEPGEKRLVAYVAVPDDGLSLDELRDHLRERLPEYMVPSAWLILPELPLTANGKVDRSALPLPETDHAPSIREFVPPRTPIEEIVAQVWADVLALERVSVTDSFFDLGGHSLLAIRILSRIYDSFEIDMPLRVLFQGPTVERLTEEIVQRLLAQQDND